MVISTQTLDSAGDALNTVLVDKLQILDVGDPVTTGIHVTRSLFPAGNPVDGLVQTVTLENAVESRANTAYSIKVGRRTALVAGQAVRVLHCRMEPDLAGKTLLVDKVTLNGMALIRKATASDFENVNQEGKVVLS